jgi:hypothetical protein
MIPGHLLPSPSSHPHSDELVGLPLSDRGTSRYPESVVGTRHGEHRQAATAGARPEDVVRGTERVTPTLHDQYREKWKLSTP